MGVAFRAQHAADHHLRFGKTPAEHVHQRNRAALAYRATRSAEKGVGCFIQRCIKPGRTVGRIPAGSAAVAFKGDFGLVGRVVFQQGFELAHGGAGIDQGRKAQGQLERGVRPQHITGVLHGRKAVCAGHAQRGPPGAVKQGFDRVSGGGQGKYRPGAFAVGMRPRKALGHFVAQNRGCGFGLRPPGSGNFAVKSGGQQAAGGAVFQPVQHMPQDAKARWHHAAGITRMHAFGQYFDFQDTGCIAAQAGSQPQLVVVARA